MNDNDPQIAYRNDPSGPRAPEKTGPYWLFFLYVFFEFARPQAYFPVIGVVRPAMLVGLALLIYWLAKGNKGDIKETPVLMVAMFIFVSALSLAYVVNHSSAFHISITLMMYLFGSILPAITFIKTGTLFRKFIKFWLFIHMTLALYALTHGGYGPGGFLGDENDLALTLNMALPYAYFMTKSPLVGNKGKLYYMLCFVVIAAGVIATNSRGGFLGMVMVLLGAIYFSKNRVRNALGLLLLSSVFFMFLPGEYISEVESITDPTESTRQERIKFWRIGWRMYVENPVLGVGAGNYPWQAGAYQKKLEDYDPALDYNRSGRQAHSIYFTLLPELGTVGLLLFAICALSLYRRLVGILRIERSWRGADPWFEEQAHMARAMLVAMFSFLVCGAFISVMWYPNFWYLIGYAVALERLVRARCEAHAGGAGVVRGASATRT